MWIMTYCTGFYLYRIISMGFFKCRITFIMTCEAQKSISFYKKVVFIRAVGKMAFHTAIRLHCLINYIFFIFFLLMALIANFTPLCLKKMFCLRGMRIMTKRAFPLFQCCVHLRFIHSYFFF